MELKSVLGYSKDSPYKNSPFLDIFTPGGLIDMSNTEMDLMGVDNLGNVKKMKAGAKNPYQFEGQTVREIPIKKNPFQIGGVNQDMLGYLFDDDEEEMTAAPVEEEVFEDESKDLALAKNERILQQRINDELAMEQANMSGVWDNPYRPNNQDMLGDGLDLLDDTYTQALSSGKYGNQNVGQQGQKIISDLTSALGYTPTFNSIYRDATQQADLVRQGVGVSNSYHLTGDAVDMKPDDWNNLPSDKKMYFRANYDVVYHNNHYHIEPKN
jgi:hypothetical protein